MPHDLGAERALLGAVLIDERVVSLVADRVSPEDFYLPTHGALWRLFLRMAQAGEPIDLVTVASRVLVAPDKGRGEFGAPGYVAELPEHCPSTAPAATYAERVAATAHQRRLLAGLHEAQRRVRAGEDSGQVFEALLAATATQKRTDTWTADESWSINEDEADRILMGTQQVASERVMSSGYTDLDRVLGGGFRGGDLVIVGATTSMGKSSLAMGMMTSALLAGRRALYLSCEPRRPEWTQRLMSRTTGVPLGLCRPAAARLRSQKDWDVLAQYAELREDLRRLTLVYKPGLSLSQAVTYAKREALRGQIDYLVVDHIHLMNHGKGRDERSDQAVARTSQGLKELAGELNCAVVALAQFNRSADSIERRRDKPRTSDGEWWDAIPLPVPADLRESGALEQDADIILFPVRASAAGPGGSPLLSGPDGVGDNAAVVKVAKQRNGPTARVGLTWDAECSSFRDRPALFSNNRGGEL